MGEKQAKDFLTSPSPGVIEAYSNSSDFVLKKLGTTADGLTSSEVNKYIRLSFIRHNDGLRNMVVTNFQKMMNNH